MYWISSSASFLTMEDETGVDATSDDDASLRISLLNLEQMESGDRLGKALLRC